MIRRLRRWLVNRIARAVSRREGGQPDRDRHCWVMVTLSTAASIRLPPDASAAWKRRRIDWPAKAFRLAVRVVQTAASFAAVPSSWKIWVAVPLALTTNTR